MAILLNDNFKIAAAKPIDNRYGPYINVAAAKSAIPVAQRHPGLVVGIRDGGDVVEHWFKAGVTNNDLVQKTSATSGGDWYVISTSSSVADNSYVIADSSSVGFTLTLSASPEVGAYVWIQDAKGSWQTNNVIVDPNGNQIVGLSDSLSLNVSNSIVLLTYVGGDVGWDVKNVAGDFSDEFTILTPLTTAAISVGSSTQCASLTIDQYGRVASASNSSITPQGIGAVSTADVISIAKGGTGATDQLAAIANLGAALSADVKIYTSSLGSWSKPANAKSVHMIVLAGGGSGQGGGMWDGATAVAAAAGGGGGGINETTYDAANLPSTLNISVGNGGASTAGRSTAGGPVNGNSGTATSIYFESTIFAHASPGLGGGLSSNTGGVYNGNNGATTTAVAGSSMRGGAGGGRGGALTAGGTAANGTNGADAMAGALPGGIVGTGRNSANGDVGGAGGSVNNLPATSASSGGGGGGTSAWASGIGGNGGAGGGYGTGGGGGGAGKAGGGNSGPGMPGFAVIITYF